MTKTSELYRQVIFITEEYLGPAAERFVSRQISFHLHKPPQELSPEDLDVFMEWAKVTFSLLTEDQHIIDEYLRKITALREG